MGGGEEGAKRLPTSFSPSFNLFATLVQNFKAKPSASPKLFNLYQDHPSKKVVFLVKSL